MSKKKIASVAIAGFVAIGATRKRPHADGDEPKHAAEDDQMSASAPDFSETRAEVDSPSGPAAKSVALRPAPGHVDDAGSGVPAAGVKRVGNLAGAATGRVAESRAANAGLVAETIESTYARQAAQAASRSSFLQDTAAKVQAAAEKAAKEGTRAGGLSISKATSPSASTSAPTTPRTGSQARCSTRGRAQGISPTTLAVTSRASSPAASG